MSLLSVGTLAFDDITTPYGRAEKIVGGSCTFIAYAASYYASEIQIVSVIGEDFPISVMNDLKSRGADLDGVELKQGEKSFFWAGRYHDDMMGRDTLDTQLNVLADFDPKLPNSYRDTDYIMLGNLTPAVQMQVINQLASEPKLLALDTMNFWMNTALDSLLEVLKKIDILIINDEEARQLSGELSLLQAAEKIATMGPSTLVIKKGEHGALLFQEGKIFFAPALLLPKVVDPTGAGDTFAGGFMGYMAASDDTSFENMKRAIIHGSALASFCVEDFGTRRLENLTKADIDGRVQQFADLVRVDV
ncbi:MAG: PfkB family carbohydrate kinase [Bacteroidota bacterium]